MASKKNPVLDGVTAWRNQRMPFLAGAQTRSSFFQIVAKFLPELDPRYQAIQKAYDIAKDAFRGDQRASGERYFEHLRAVALILLVYLEVRDYELIIAALLHDIVEDKREEWSIQRVRNEFGDRVALLLSFLTEPQNGEFASKEESEEVYHARFELADRDFFLVKLSDRLHNLLTLGARPRVKQLAKIEETVRYYMPYARKYLILLPELREVLLLLETKS